MEELSAKPRRLSPRRQRHKKGGSAKNVWAVGKQKGAREEDDDSPQAHRRDSSPEWEQTQATAAFVCASAALYGGVRSSIHGFHLLRRKFMRSMLLEVCPILAELGLTYWVDFGSLLGIYRDGDLIIHDNDVDVAILNPPDWAALQRALRGRLRWPLSCGLVTPSEDASLRWLRVYCPLGMMDLYGAYDRGGDNLAIDIGHNGLCDVPKHLVLPTGKLTFRDVELRVPADVPGVLRHRYGPTFMTPRYMDKGADTVEQNKPYARLLTALGKLGLKI